MRTKRGAARRGGPGGATGLIRHGEAALNLAATKTGERARAVLEKGVPGDPGAFRDPRLQCRRPLRKPQGPSERDTQAGSVDTHRAPVGPAGNDDGTHPEPLQGVLKKVENWNKTG
jgi:hypothetical protein